MAIVGCLGDVIFTVSKDVVRTLDNMVWSGSARYAVHERHLYICKENVNLPFLQYMKSVASVAGIHDLQRYSGFLNQKADAFALCFLVIYNQYTIHLNTLLL